MKRMIKAATNASGIPSNPDVIEAADDNEASDSLEDKLGALSDSFDYIMDGISQLDLVQGNEIANRLNDDLQSYISDIASNLV